MRDGLRPLHLLDMRFKLLVVLKFEIFGRVLVDHLSLGLIYDFLQSLLLFLEFDFIVYVF